MRQCRTESDLVRSDMFATPAAFAFVMEYLKLLVNQSSFQSACMADRIANRDTEPRNIEIAEAVDARRLAERVLPSESAASSSDPMSSSSSLAQSGGLFLNDSAPCISISTFLSHNHNNNSHKGYQTQLA